ncbi:MAG: PKD domain-containing protein, partial [Chitinophagaceae bacterium]|nr:PKD domain-containing protein [Chitinophagaceae bacterium]
MKYILNVDQYCYAGTTYNFLSLSGGTFIGLSGNSFTILWGAANTGQVQISFTTPGNFGLAPCSGIIIINFTLVPKPVAAFTATPQPVCNMVPTTINFNSSATTNASNYFWNFGDSYTALTQNPSHTYSSPGTYTVTLYAANNAYFNGSPQCPTCIDSVKHNITIDVLPPPEIKCVASVCAGDIVQYCAADNTCSGYAWTVTGGIIQSGQGTSCVTIKWGSGNPQGTINLVSTGCSTPYCASGATVTVPIIPATGSISGPALVCNNTNATYTLPSWPGTTYSWSLSSGGSITPYNTNTNQINIFWNTFGLHTITCSYFDTSLKCGGSATYNVQVSPNLSISGPATVCQGGTTNLNATMPTNIPVASNWTINPGSAVINSGNGTPTINVTWPTVGSYNVTASPVVPNTTCDNANYTVTVLPIPVISSINGPDSICAGSTHVYSATSNLSGTFSWSINNASSFNLLGANNDSVQVTWGTTGPFSISVSQSSTPFGCISNTLIKNVFLWPTPALSGPSTVCADAVVSYSITNILNANFQWSVSPANFGTILSGQGTNSITIHWHGNNSPGNSNTVLLNYGVCGNASIPITINEPSTPVITASGTLCGPGGITLSTGATGTFSWAGPGGPIPGNSPSISGITIPGNYTVQIQNYNGSGCTVSTNYNIPDVGRPVASISADKVLNYCLPTLPDLNLVAVNGTGYTFQWYQAPGTLLTGETNPTLHINTLTTAGSYSYYCVVSLGGCVVTSNTLTIVISNCTASGCYAAIKVNGITGCNPFNLTIAATAPAGAVINGTGSPTI